MVGFVAARRCVMRELKAAKRAGLEPWAVGHVEGVVWKADLHREQSRKRVYAFDEEQREYSAEHMTRALNELAHASSVLMDFARLSGKMRTVVLKILPKKGQAR